jgi:D-inositol-3-phosphate glycosyltransferase
MVALESMACGTPVVASQVGGLAFLIQDNETGFLVPGQEPEALADRLSILVENAALRREMGDRAQAHAQQYAWEIIAGEVSQLYEDVLAAGKTD